MAPTKVRSCEYCGTAFPAGRVGVIRPPRPWAWGSLRGIVGCESCGLRFPLERVMPDSPIECAHCGTPRGLNSTMWPVAFDMAHDYGVRRPYGDEGIGVTKIGSTMPFLVNAATPAMFSPGHPLCATCRTPLSGSFEGDRTITTCAGCGDRAEHLLPPAARTLYPALRGIVALAHRVDRHASTVERPDGRAVALRCPECGGPLEPPTGSPMVTCNHCRQTSIVTPGIMSRLAPKRLDLRLIWLAFEGRK